MAATTIGALPEDCIAHIISFTFPRTVCQSAILSTVFRNAADSDLVWEKLLPSDYLDIISKLVSPIKFTSKKELYLRLCCSLLIDGGRKTFSIDKYTNKKCYMLSARELTITWSSNPLNWCWKSLSKSRFPEAVELIMIHWLDIRVKVNTKILSPNTRYGAYLVVQLAGRAFGLHSHPSEVSVVIGDYKSHGVTYLRHNKDIKEVTKCTLVDNKANTCLGLMIPDGEERVLCKRQDGWLEVELGVFFSDESDKEVIMSFRETKGEHLKGGLIVEGIEIRSTC